MFKNQPTGSRPASIGTRTRISTFTIYLTKHLAILTLLAANPFPLDAQIAQKESTVAQSQRLDRTQSSRRNAKRIDHAPTIQPDIQNAGAELAKASFHIPGPDLAVESQTQGDQEPDSDPPLSESSRSVLTEPPRNELPLDAPATRLAPPKLPGKQDPDNDDSTKAAGPLVVTASQEPYRNPIFTKQHISFQDGYTLNMGITPISELNVNAQATEVSAPQDHAAQVFDQVARIEYVPDCGTACRWHQYGATAADFCYQPLFWEEINLERYGTSVGRLQPVVSATRFFGTFPLLPYKMTRQPPACHFRKTNLQPAGLPAPWIPEAMPFSRKSGLAEGLAIGAAILIFP